MNIFKKIGIILSCSIIAFLGVFGVVATSSNVNIQVIDLPLVERHNLVGSDIVLTESNYSEYYLSPNLINPNENIGFSGNFIISGKFLTALDETGFIVDYIYLDNETVYNMSFMQGMLMFGIENVEDYLCGNNYYISEIFKLNEANLYVKFNSLEFGADSANDIDTFLNFLNNNFSIYELPPVVDQFLPTITTIVSDCVSWFVSIFTGLSDTFVLTDSNGVITGLSAWGQVLFIGVAILLVSMALKWVISLVRGI